MLPEGHRGVIVCDTRRAERWRDAFVAEGIDAQIVETRGDEADRGACKVTVPAKQLLAAQAIVSDVHAGKRRLRAPMSWKVIVALLGILCLMVWILVH